MQRNAEQDTTEPKLESKIDKNIEIFPSDHAASASAITTEQDKTAGVCLKRKRSISWEALVNRYRTWCVASKALHDRDTCQRVRDEAERALEKAKKELDRQTKVRRVAAYHMVLCRRKYAKCN